MDSFQGLDVVPLTFERMLGNNRQTGLAVTVQVTNASNGATLLPPTACPEVGTATGIYTYNWTHGLNATTQCTVTFRASGQAFEDSFLIAFGPSGGRGV